MSYLIFCVKKAYKFDITEIGDLMFSVQNECWPQSIKVKSKIEYICNVDDKMTKSFLSL